MLAVVAVSRAYRAFLLTLLTVAMIPLLWGWSSFVVTSGSMEPSFSAGDVIVAAPLTAQAPVPIGRVMVFTNPAQSDSGVPLVHRVVAAKGDRFVTAGDANANDDTMAASRRMFQAEARILVPLVGRPVTWLTTDRVPLLVLWLVLTGLAFVVAGLPRRWSRHDRRPGGRAGPLARTRSRLWRVLAVTRRSHSLSLAVVGVAFGTLAISTATASAGFHSTTGNGFNRWTATNAMLQPYNTQVLADAPYLYYLLDEPSGATASDYSGNNRAGTYASVGAYGQTGALPGNFGYAVALNGGQGQVIGGGTAGSNPTTFTLELWFKTTTTTGGKLIGFESTRNATSATADRHVFMRPDGRIVYGGWVNSGTSTITSTNAYNNGVWHHLALTAKASPGNQQTSILYVDGVSVASGTTTRTSSYTGWWRLGYGSLPTGATYPTTAGFAGQIDNAAVYLSQLTASRIAAHYAAR
jgi:signal peptidase I